MADEEVFSMTQVNRIRKPCTASLVPGKRNKKKGAECEDVMYIDENAALRFYGLADGQSGKRYCREGGSAVLKNIALYLKKRSLLKLQQYEYQDEIKYELIKIVRQTISFLAEQYHEDAREFASTILIFAFDPQSRKYMTIHLGDGGVIGARKDGAVGFISAPENGITVQYTWLTTSKNALEHLRIGFGSINCYKRVTLYTDGAMALSYGKNISPGARTILSSAGAKEADTIFNFIQQSEPVDDASCIIVDLNK